MTIAAALIAAVYFWSPQANLRVTTGLPGSTAYRFITAFASVTEANHPRIHIKLVQVADLAASAKAIEDHATDLGIVRSDAVTGLRVLRHDDLTRPSLTGSGIWEGLREADIVVADVTGKNPYVFYELGITQAIGKPTVLIARDSLDVPFDVRHLRVIVYKTDPRSLEVLRGNLRDALRRVIEASSDQMRIPTRSSIADKVPTSDAIRAVLERADQEMARGEYREATTSLQEAASLQEKSDDLPGLARTFIFLGSAYQATGQYDAALLWLQQALDISKRIGEPRSQAAAASNLANVLARTSDLERAKRFYEEALAPSRTVGDANLEANTVANLGYLLYQMGLLDEAGENYSRALQLFQAIGSLHGEAMTHANLAALMLKQGRWVDAEWRLREADGILSGGIGYFGG